MGPTRWPVPPADHQPHHLPAAARDQQPAARCPDVAPNNSVRRPKVDRAAQQLARPAPLTARLLGLPTWDCSPPSSLWGGLPSPITLQGPGGRRMIHALGALAVCALVAKLLGCLVLVPDAEQEATWQHPTAARWLRR